MVAQAHVEADRRDKYIVHHFEVGHMNRETRDMVGFLGEFACCKLLGQDWKANIRKDYLDIDSFDIEYKGKRIDVKTETVGEPPASRIISRVIGDNVVYGRRLINQGQWNLLQKYDIIIFGLFIRNQLDKWYPVGYRDTAFLLANYTPQKKQTGWRHLSFSGKRY